MKTPLRGQIKRRRLSFVIDMQLSLWHILRMSNLSLKFQVIG